MTQTVYFAAGCFWGAQKYFDCIDGVISTEVGYSNGRTENPSYEQVKHENTGHAETVKVVFDPDRVSIEELFERYFRIIDPTSVNRQGGDFGEQYRTGIYSLNPEHLKAAAKAVLELQKRYSEPIAVEVCELKQFFTAEEYHQKYLDKNPQGYCHIPSEMFENAKKSL